MLQSGPGSSRDFSRILRARLCVPAYGLWLCCRLQYSLELLHHSFVACLHYTDSQNNQKISKTTFPFNM